MIILFWFMSGVESGQIITWIVVFLLAVLLGCAPKNNEHANKAVVSSVTDSMPFTLSNQLIGSVGQTFYLRCHLQNKADSLHFWTMSCSVEENWLSSNPQLYIAATVCDKNFPQRIKLAPNQTMDFYLQLQAAQGQLDSLVGKQVRMGFVYVSEKETNPSGFQSILTTKIQRNEVYWTPPITIGLTKQLQDIPAKKYVVN